LPNSGAETQIELQYLLDHSRAADEIGAIDEAIKSLEPLLPEGAKFETSYSIGTDIFLLRELDNDELDPEKLDKILSSLTKFAEFAVTKVSILHLATEFKLRAAGT